MKEIPFSLMWLPLLCGLAWAENAVHFSDPNLKTAVEDTLWVTDPTPTDMLGLTGLTCNGAWDLKHAIVSLTGLEYATNLQALTLRYHLIGDLSPLSGLTNLQTLILADNQISDISILSGLNNLRTLDLESNLISDISALSALGSLETLNLHRNEVSNISPLLGLTCLQSADLRVNPLNQNAYDTYLAQIIANNPGIWIVYDPSFYRYLVTASTAGGSVTNPGEGTFNYEFGQSVRLVAEADPGFVFAAWTGSYYGMRNPVELVMNQDVDVRASFLSTRDVIYVDDDAAEDPGPGNSTRSDPHEDGTPEHPFDCIQEAIEVAADQAQILVRPGTYRENIDFLGRSIHLAAIDPNDPHRGPCAIIEGTSARAVVRLSDLGRKCSLTGFVITRGKGQPAGAIYCAGASPTIANCLIVGNRSTDPNGAAVYCKDSRAIMANCTIADNYAGERGAALTLVDSNVVVVNSILWGNSPNEILSLGTSDSSITYCDIGCWWLDYGDFNADPLFARRGRWASPIDPNVTLTPQDDWAAWVPGDYHLKSQAGRWNPAVRTWVRDDVTSPCINRGDRGDPVGQEPPPNSDIINIGAYGGTNQASKSHMETSSL